MFIPGSHKPKRWVKRVKWHFQWSSDPGPAKDVSVVPLLFGASQPAQPTSERAKPAPHQQRGCGDVDVDGHEL